MQIKPNDPLPKTICKTCMERVQSHHALMVRLQKHRNVFNNNSTRLNQTTDTESATRQIASDTNDDTKETSQSTTC